MTATKSHHRILVAVLGLAAGSASAHQGPHLISHAHPHLGIEHLLAGAILALGVFVLSRLARRG